MQSTTARPDAAKYLACPVVAEVDERRQEGGKGRCTTHDAVNHSTARCRKVSCVLEYVFNARVVEDVIAGQDVVELGTQRFTADATLKYHAQDTVTMAPGYEEAPIIEHDGRISP